MAHGATQIGSAHPTRSNPFRAFRSRDFRRVWSANFFYYASRWMLTTLLALLVLDLTNSPWQVALIGFFMSVPTIPLGPIGGLLADRLERPRLLLCSHAADFVTLAVLALVLSAGWTQSWHIYLAAIVVGICWALDFPSRRSLNLDLLGKEGVANGVALEFVAMNGSKIFGPALAGVMVSFVGYSSSMAVVAVLYLVAALLLWSVRAPKVEVSRRRPSPLGEIVAGLGYIRRDSTIAAAVAISAIMNFLITPYTQMVPVIGKQVLDAGPVLIGLLLSTHGLAGLIGSLFIASMADVKHHGRLYVGGCVLAMVGLLLFALSRFYGLSVPTLFLLGLGFSGFTAMECTIILLVASPDMRGRALSGVSLAQAGIPLGTLMVGSIATAVSPSFALGLNAVLGLSLIALVWILMPSLRRPLRAL